MNGQKILLVIVALLVIGGAGVYFSNQNSSAPSAPLDGSTPVAVAEESAPAEEASVAETVAEETTTTPEAAAQEQAAQPSAPPVQNEETEKFTVEKAMSERGIGLPDAAVRIDEYASLTCSHCADFSKTIFPQLKKEYIDTGKIYFVFNDFPLNAPALDAAAVARCLPSGRYLPFVEFLFEKQEEWAFQNDPREKLKQNAKLVGMGDKDFDKCVNNKDLRKALADKMEAAAKEHDIKATPTFLINNGQHVLSGARPFDDFKKLIDPILAEASKSEGKAQ